MAGISALPPAGSTGHTDTDSFTGKSPLDLDSRIGEAAIDTDSAPFCKLVSPCPNEAGAEAVTAATPAESVNVEAESEAKAGEEAESSEATI
jgi:hypothetical protein